MDLPAWISAVASAGAFAFAAPAAFAAYRVLKIEMARDKAADEERKAWQAARVSAWCGQHDHQWGTFLWNASEAPIYDVVIEYYRPDECEVPQSLKRSILVGSDDQVKVLPPSNEPQFVVVTRKIEDDLILTARTMHLAVVGLTFRDAAGHSWRRDATGYLIEGWIPKAANSDQ
jgi:hypothetical protein